MSIQRRLVLVFSLLAVAAPHLVGSAHGQESIGESSRRMEDDIPSLIRARVQPINNITVDLEPEEGELPEDHGKLVFSDQLDSYAGREWATVDFHWEASELVFQPPYWEDTPLERYGQTRAPRLQPILSGVHFFGTFPIIPYKMGIDGPLDHISTLGYYRPGSPTPCVRQRLPWDWNAALIQAGVTTGLGFLP